MAVVKNDISLVKKKTCLSRFYIKIHSYGVKLHHKMDVVGWICTKYKSIPQLPFDPSWGLQ